jgi:ABC-type transport system substrate-binding protein
MKKHKSVVIYTILNFLVALSLFVFSPKDLESRENPVFGGIYRRPLEFCPKILDPALSTDSYAVTVIQQVFDGLVQFDKNLNVVPAIAKSWKISITGGKSLQGTLSILLPGSLIPQPDRALLIFSAKSWGPKNS